MNEILIGNVKIKYPLGLAPMAGFTDHTFRTLCKEMGAGILYTEMVSAKAITYRNRNTNDIMDMTPDENPVALQLFGSEPDVIAEAIKMIEEKPYDIIDLNMGCPVPKVVKNGEGSALMKQPLLAEQIFKAMVKASSKPVTIKIRAGFNDESINAPEIAKIAEECGISAVAVHARTREQYYSGHADWDVIRKVKESVSIPVFGNGDIVDAASARDMLAKTGCDGILVGRAACGNPWIFAQIKEHLDDLSNEKTPLRPQPDEVISVMKRHAKALVLAKGEYIGVRQMRTHAASYLKGFKNAASLRRTINLAQTLEELNDMLDTVTAMCDTL